MYCPLRFSEKFKGYENAMIRYFDALPVSKTQVISQLVPIDIFYNTKPNVEYDTEHEYLKVFVSLFSVTG